MLKRLANAVKRKKQADRSQNFGLFLMALPMMIVVTIFSYIPMAGMIVAFKNYSYRDGIRKYLRYAERERPHGDVRSGGRSHALRLPVLPKILHAWPDGRRRKRSKSHIAFGV